MLQPEAHQSIDEHMCKFKGKNMMIQYMKNKPIKWGCKFFFFFVEPSLASCMNSICILERKEIPNLVSLNLLFFHCARTSKMRIVLYSLTTFLQVQHCWSSCYKWGFMRQVLWGPTKRICQFWSMTRRWNTASMIGFLQITFQPLNGWTISQLYFHPITSTKVDATNWT